MGLGAKLRLPGSFMSGDRPKLSPEGSTMLRRLRPKTSGIWLPGNPRGVAINMFYGYPQGAVILGAPGDLLVPPPPILEGLGACSSALRSRLKVGVRPTRCRSAFTLALLDVFWKGICGCPSSMRNWQCLVPLAPVNCLLPVRCGVVYAR
jgi:hypothetical protein